jgi:hypothetical protein
MDQCPTCRKYDDRLLERGYCIHCRSEIGSDAGRNPERRPEHDTATAQDPQSARPPFELPCTCGRRLAVSAGDAGTEIRCKCGRAVEVPDLGKLRALHQNPEPPAHGAGTAPPGSSSPKQKERPRPPIPPWAWIFVVACGIIPVLTLGGAIPTGIGVGGAAACLNAARNQSWPVAGRVVLCAVITIGCWAAVIILLRELFAMLQGG